MNSSEEIREARSLINVAFNARVRGDFDEAERVDLGEAERLHREALAIHKEVGDRLNEAVSLYYLGLIAKIHGDDESASEYLQKSKAIRLEIFPFDNVE
ncbi:MAG: tetratricopeptide repeat protein [Aquiluna sp.]